MYKYREIAPMKFHRFLCYFCLPVGFLANLGNLLHIFDTPTYGRAYAFYSVIIAALSCVLMVLQVSAFVGAFFWSPVTYYGVISLFTLNIVSAYYQYLLILDAENTFFLLHARRVNLYSSVYHIYLIASVTLCVWILIYYRRRRNLFINYSSVEY